MIVDTSALIAVVQREPEWQRIVDLLDQSSGTGISTMTFLELQIVLSSGRFAAPDLAEQHLTRFRIQPIDFTLAHSKAAGDAYANFGRGSHPARLNFGDCASYATAKLARQPLLFVGTDFAQTDVQSALGLPGTPQIGAAIRPAYQHPRPHRR